MRVSGHQHAVYVELKKLFLMGADGCRASGSDDRRFQMSRRFRGVCESSNEELVINVSRAEGMKGEPRIASKIGGLG